MNTLKMVCVEISVREEGYSVVAFQISSNDETIYADGMVRFTITDSSGFEVNKEYDLNLNEIINGGNE